MKKRFVFVLFGMFYYSLLSFASEKKDVTFNQNGYVFRIIDDNKVELIEIPQKYKKLQVENAPINFTEIITYKKKQYDLVSIANHTFSDIHRGNRIVLQIPSTVNNIGIDNHIDDLFYNYTTYNKWLDEERTILLNRNSDSIVWVNKLKASRFKTLPLPITLKKVPVWFWECFPNLQTVVFPEELDKTSIQQLLDDCTPYMKGNMLFLITSNKTGEVIWKSPLCSHVTILDYPSAWRAEHEYIIKKHFTDLEICNVDGCEYPCILLDGIPYNSFNGKPAITLGTKQRFDKDTLSLSHNQFYIATRGFITSQSPKHINVVNNTKGVIRFDSDILEYVSELVKADDITTSFIRINTFYIDTISTPYENYFGNFYNPLTNDLFLLNKHDTLEISIKDKDENKHVMLNYIEKLVALQGAKHIIYNVERAEALSSFEKTNIERIRAAGGSVSPSEVYTIVEVQPEFPGGLSECMKFLQKNIRYPAICQEKGIQGRVVVQFVVGTNGDIEDIRIFKSVNPLLDQEAIRVISIMPPWKPGMQKGKAVRTRFTMPVTFRLSKGV